jgi:hypothetical protein
VNLALEGGNACQYEVAVRHVVSVSRFVEV